MAIFQNPHFQTIAPALIRSSPNLNFHRVTIDTPDNDFLDLDYYEPNHSSEKLAILIHGLEGSSQDSYMTNTIQKLAKQSINSLAMNLRSCSGRPNNKPYSYHSGKSIDLRTVLKSVKSNYKEIYLIGFSIGGNITLKFLGEDSTAVDPRIKKAFVVSPPLDLESSAKALAQPSTYIYMQNLLKNLKTKLVTKEKLFPEIINTKDFDEVKNFYDYDGRYTAPLNDFASAKDYWNKASSKGLLEDIRVRTIILSALDDPFLGPECFPEIKNPFVTTHYTKYGGHLGFMKFKFKKLSLYFLFEEMLMNFFNQTLDDYDKLTTIQQPASDFL